MKPKSTLIFFISILSLGSYWIACDSTEMMSAKVYVQENNLEKAEELALLAIENEPLNPYPAYWIGVNVYSVQKRWEDLKKTFDISLSISDKFVKEIAFEKERHWRNEFMNGANTYNAVLNDESSNPDSSFEYALTSFANAAIIIPDSAKTYSSIALIYIYTKQIDLAKEYLIKAAVLDPSDIKNLLNLSSVYGQEENYEEANVQLRKILEIEPGNMRALRQLAQNSDILGNSEEALAMYQKGFDLDPENSDLLFNMGNIYYNNADYKKAEEMFIKSLELKPDDCDAISNVALAYSKMEGNYEDAEKYYLKAADCAPAEPIYWRQLVGIYMKMGKPDKAQEALDKAKELGYKP